MRILILFVIIIISNSSYSQRICNDCFKEMNIQGQGLKGKIAISTEYEFDNSNDELKEIRIKYFDKSKMLNAELFISDYASDSISYIYENGCLSEKKKYKITYSPNKTKNINGTLLMKDSLVWSDYWSEKVETKLVQHDKFEFKSLDSAKIKSLMNRYTSEFNKFFTNDKSTKHIAYRYYKCNRESSQYFGLDSVGNIITNQEYIFDKKGNTVIINSIDKLWYTNYINYEYDSNNNLIRWSGYTKFEPENYVFNYRSTDYINSDFDENGNWRVSNYRNRIIIREIEYYE